jgi:hypothetical protein
LIHGADDDDDDNDNNNNNNNNNNNHNNCNGSGFFYPRGRTPVPTKQETGWVVEPVWTF